MSRKAGLFILAAITAGALLYFQVQRRQPASVGVAQSTPTDSRTPTQTAKRNALRSQAALPGAGAGETVAPDALSAAPQAAPPPAPSIEEVASSLPGETVLANMRTTILQFASTYGENPVGTNPEITSALQGENPKHINFLKPDGNRVNARGELVDTWGSPYFFHQISGHEMEIRSAGPDRVMYTADDLVTR
jgi:hypothetical protein